MPIIKPIIALNSNTEFDELDRLKAAYMLHDNLQKAESRAEKESWIDADDLEKELGVFDEN